METPTRSQECFPSPTPLAYIFARAPLSERLEQATSPQSMLFGRTEDSSGVFGGKATLIRGRGGKICCGK